MDIVHVLLLEDHEGEARLSQRLLERSYTTEFRFTNVRTLAESLQALASDSYDIALLDLNLPDSRGIDTFISFQSSASDLPVVIISAVADDRLAQTAIRYGAQDYLVKGNITSETLTRVVRYAIARKEAEKVAGRISLRPNAVGAPPSGAFVLDAQGQVTLATGQLSALLGQPDTLSMLHRPLAGFFHESERDRILDAIDRVRRGTGADYVVVHVLPEEDLTRRLLLTFAAMPQAGCVQGNIVPAPEGIDDDSEGAQLALRYRTLLEHSQDGVFILSGGKVLFANRSLAEMLGYGIENILGVDIASLVAPEDSRQVSGNIQRRLEGEEAETVYEINMLHRGGSRIRVQLSFGRIALPSGIDVMGTVKNVSDAHRTSYLMRLQHRLAINLAHSRERSEIFEHLLQGVLRIENIDVAAVFMLDQDSGHFVPATWRGLKGPFPSKDGGTDFDQLHERLIREASARFLDAAALKKERLGEMLSPEGIRSFGLIPVTHGGRSLAAIDVASLTSDRFDEIVQQTLESIASFLGGVLARVAAEEAQQESELLYRAVVEKSHDAIFIYRNDRIVFANEKTTAVTGYDRETLLSLNPWTLIHPEDRTRIQGIAAKRVSGADVPIVYEGRILTRDGTIRIGEFAATLIRYGGELSALITVRDVTSRKSQEDELMRSDALIRAAGLAAARFLRTASWEDCIMEVLERFGTAANVCRVVIFENVPDEKGARIMRQRAVWVRSEMRDSMIDRVPDGQSYEEKPFRRWAAELSAGNAIASVIDNLPDEEQIFLARQNVRSVAMLPVFCGSSWWGSVRFDECRIRRTWLRSEIEAMGVSAETLGAAILREESEKEIIASREQAVRADAIKNAFIANISHEVRTPVSIILGYLALVADLVQTVETDEIGEFIEAINGASHRLIRTVDSIINISRLQSQDITPQFVPIRLDKLLATCVEKIQVPIKEKELSFEFHNAWGAAEILGDERFLCESVNHLLDNAVKFTSAGSIRMSLEKNAEGCPVVSIEDTGIGISEQFLEKVFDPYLQEDMGFNRRYEGIGLGLTLVKLYVEAHGAIISIRSRKGEGTHVAVTFPAAGH